MTDTIGGGNRAAGGMPDRDVLADYAAGVVTHVQRRAVDALLESDPEWARAWATLQEEDAMVVGELRTLPRPTMPGEVAARLAAVVRFEAAQRGAGNTASAPEPAANVVVDAESPADPPASAPEPRRHPPAPGPRRWRWTPLRISMVGALAAIVLLAGVGAGLAQVFDSDPTDRGSAQQDKQGADGPAPAATPSSRVGESEEAADSLSSSGAAPTTAPDQGSRPLYAATGTNYRRTELRAQVDWLLTHAGALAPAELATVAPAEIAGLTPSDRRSGCVAGLRTANRLVAVDYARYADAPAAVIVTRADGGALVVYAVGPACGSANPAVIDVVTL